MIGRIDVHSHLLPGIDDGCTSVEMSIACARMLVAAGYTHSFVTPHIWPAFPQNTAPRIIEHTRRLQADLDAAGVGLTLMPGGELNISRGIEEQPPERMLTYNLAEKYALGDIWADALPDFFWPAIRWIQDKGFTFILAHPERMAAVQRQPQLTDQFAQAGILLQGNLQCFADPPQSPTRVAAERFLTQGRYFLLGSDTHNLQSLPLRLRGLDRAIELAGENEVDRLTRENPRKLMP